jgi:RHS repeat-associated protein
VWRADAWATLYFLTGQDAAGTHRVERYVDAADACHDGVCSATPNVALVPGTFTWRVTAIDEASYGPDGPSLTFTAGVPIPIAPSGVVATVTPTYAWQAVPGATLYRLWATDGSSTLEMNQWYEPAAVGCAGGPGPCTGTPGTGLPEGPAVWWVQAVGAWGYGPPSTGVAITVTRPGSIAVLAPSGPISTTRPTYTWHPDPLATLYFLVVDDAAGTRRVAAYYDASAICSGGVCSATPEVTLVPGSFTWTVTGIDGAGYGLGGPVLTFTAGVPIPIAPTGAVGTGTPAYSWQAVPGATLYRLWATDGESTLEMTQWYEPATVGCAGGTGTCGGTPAAALREGAATWWVQAVGAWGYGPASSGVALTVARPGSITLTAPSGEISATTPTYAWQADPLATLYFLTVTDSGGTRRVATYVDASGACSGSVCAATPEVDLGPGAFTWSVTGIDDVGYGAGGPPMPFTAGVLMRSDGLLSRAHSAEGSSEPSEGVEYYHLDALGSVRAVTDAQGAVIARHDFLPFGEEIAQKNPAKDRKLFTGQERDFETGMDYFNARQLRPDLGRFLAPDPLGSVPTPLSSQGFNAYAYVLNNPLRLIDPTGLDPEPRTYMNVPPAVMDSASFVGTDAPWGADNADLDHVFEVADARAALTEFANYIAGFATPDTDTQGQGGAAPAPTKQFPGIDAAGIAAEKLYNPASINKNLEFSGNIYKDASGQCCFIQTPAVGKPTQVNAPDQKTLPSGAIRVALFHTHGAFDRRYDNEHFSSNDQWYAYRRGVLSFLGTPRGVIRKYDPATGITKTFTTRTQIW